MKAQAKIAGVVVLTMLVMASTMAAIKGCAPPGSKIERLCEPTELYTGRSYGSGPTRIYDCTGAEME